MPRLTGCTRMVTEKMADRDAFARWFGGYNSTPKYPDIDWRPEEAVQIDRLRETLAAGASLRRNPASRFSFIRQSADTLLLFVDGACFECADETATFAQQLCGQDGFKVGADLARSDSAMAIIVKLCNQGSVALSG